MGLSFYVHRGRSVLHPYHSRPIDVDAPEHFAIGGVGHRSGQAFISSLRISEAMADQPTKPLPASNATETGSWIGVTRPAAPLRSVPIAPLSVNASSQKPRCCPENEVAHRVNR